MKKPELKMLERIFTAEISGRLPFQFFRKEPAIITALEAAGMVQRHSHEERTALGMMTVAGWVLTHKGRHAYCASCPSDPETEKVLGNA